MAQSNNRTCDTEATNLSFSGSPLDFCGSVLGQDTLEPLAYTGKKQEMHEYVICCHDLT